MRHATRMHLPGITLSEFFFKDATYVERFGHMNFIWLNRTPINKILHGGIFHPFSSTCTHSVFDNGFLVSWF